jgi:hypothetical protein
MRVAFAFVISLALQQSSARAEMLETSYPGSGCSTADGQATSGGPLHFVGPELFNQTNQTLWVECPLPADYVTFHDVEFAELGFRGIGSRGSSSAVNCKLAVTQEDGTGWSFPWSATNAFNRYYELVWPTGAEFSTSVPASASFDCTVAPSTVLSMYRVTNYLNSW